MFAVQDKSVNTNTPTKSEESVNTATSYQHTQNPFKTSLYVYTHIRTYVHTYIIGNCTCVP